MMSRVKKQRIAARSLMTLILAVSIAGLIFSAVKLISFVNRIELVEDAIEYQVALKELYDEQNRAFQNYTHGGDTTYIELYRLKTEELFEKENEFLNIKKEHQFFVNDEPAFKLEESELRMEKLEQSDAGRAYIFKHWQKAMLMSASLKQIVNVTELRDNSEKVRKLTAEINQSLAKERFDYSEYSKSGNRILINLVIFGAIVIGALILLALLLVRTENAKNRLFSEHSILIGKSKEADALLREIEETAENLQKKNNLLADEEKKTQEYATILEQGFLAARMSWWRYYPEQDFFELSAKAAEMLTGNPSLNIIDKASFSKYLDADNRSGMLIEFDKSVINQSDFSLVFKTNSREAGIKYLRISGTHEIDKLGKHRKSIGVLQDITYLKEQEKQTGSLEGRITTMFELLPEIFVEFDERGKLVTLNNNAYTLFGDTFEEISAKIEDGSLFAGNYYEVFKNNWKLGVKGVHNPGKRRYDLIGKTGKVIPCEISSKYIYDSLGNLLGATAVVWDISDIVDTEAEIKRKDDLLRSAVSFAGIGVFEHNLKSDSHYWSPELFAALGLENGAFAPEKETFLDYVYPDDREFVKNQYDQVLEKGSYEFGCRVLTPAKKVKYVREWGKSVKNDAGEVVSYFGIVYDVTDIMTKELELKRINRKMREIQSVAKIGYAETLQRPDSGYKNTLLRISDEVKNIYEFSINTDVVTFPDLIKQIPESDKHIAKSIEVTARAEGKTEYSFDYRIHTPSGKEKYLHMTRKLNLDDAGNAFDDLAIIQDVTEIRKMRGKLDDARNEKNLILSSINEIVVFFDFDGKPLWSNQALNDLSQEEAEAVKLRKFILRSQETVSGGVPGDTIDIVGTVLEKGEEVRCDVKGAGAGVYLASCVPVLKETGIEGAVLSLNDISERVRIENDLRGSEKKFRTLADNALMGIFIVKGLETVYMNSYLEDLLEYKIHEMSFNTLAKKVIYKEDRKLFIQVLKTLRSGERDSMEFNIRMQTKKGALLYVVYSLNRVDFGEALSLVGTISNITTLIAARKKAGFGTGSYSE